ncbi:MAG: hypothetical protein ACK5NB_09955 [Flavobacteriaceae bacterium]
MKNFIFLSFTLIVSVFAQAQEKPNTEAPKDYSAHVLTIDSTIKSFYAVISGEKAVERDWNLFKFLFYKNAKLIPAGKDKEGYPVVNYMKPGDYIKNAEKWMVENGFFEQEISRTVQEFGNMAHVFSTYEAYHNEEEEKPFMRGINSIQLFNDGKRWWIVNVYWTHETKNNPIPDAFLMVN